VLLQRFAQVVSDSRPRALIERVIYGIVGYFSSVNRLHTQGVLGNAHP
jgi:hypothetical protein